MPFRSRRSVSAQNRRTVAGLSRTPTSSPAAHRPPGRLAGLDAARAARHGRRLPGLVRHRRHGGPGPEGALTRPPGGVPAISPRSGKASGSRGGRPAPAPDRGCDPSGMLMPKRAAAAGLVLPAVALACTAASPGGAVRDRALFAVSVTPGSAADRRRGRRAAPGEETVLAVRGRTPGPAAPAGPKRRVLGSVAGGPVRASCHVPFRRAVEDGTGGAAPRLFVRQHELRRAESEGACFFGCTQ